MKQIKQKINVGLCALILSLPAWAASYGPVQGSQTLWDIAARHRPSYSTPIPRVMAAFHAKNPHAFINGDINRLRQGVYLQVPTAAEIGGVARKGVTASVRAEIANLRAQLRQEQERSRRLAAELESLKANAPAAPQVANTQGDMLAKLQTELADLRQQLQTKDARIAELESALAEAKQAASKAGAAAPNVSPPVAAANDPEKDKMQAELAELKQLLEQRDNHIQNLQASLREASVTIKRQFAEAQAMHQQLQARNPGNAAPAPQPPAEPGSAPKPNLTLAGTEAGEGKPPQPAATAQANAQQQEQQPSQPNKPVSLQNMLEQQREGMGAAADSAATAPSKVSIVVALISLLFVLALLWRTYAQRRSLDQEEARLRAALGETAESGRT